MGCASALPRLPTTRARYPFLAYGTDWLAFAHILFAILFVGPYRDPVRNRWVVEFGLIACAGIFPLALIAGPIRQIPFYWRLGDCSFGLFGGVLLLLALRTCGDMERDRLAVRSRSHFSRYRTRAMAVSYRARQPMSRR